MKTFRESLSQLAQAQFSSPVRVVLWTIGIGTAVRFLCAAFAFDLSYGEAYYVATARHFAWSYFDHPPLSFWLTGSAIKLTGSDALLVVRAPFILLFAASSWLMFRIGAALYSEWAGALSALLLNLSPLFAISIGAWVEPDGPLIFCILASTLCIIHLAFDRAPELWLWAQAGFWLGLAMLAKYYAVLLPVGILLFALTSPKHREWFFKPGPYLACAIAVALLTPILIWNLQHHWVSLDFQGERAVDFSGINIVTLLLNIFGQAGFIGPWIWIPMLLACAFALREGRANSANWFLLCVALVPIVFFTVISLWVRTRGHYHWQAIGYLFLFPLLAKYTLEKLQERDAWTRGWLAFSIAAPLLLLAIIGAEASTGWVHAIFKNALQPRYDFSLGGMKWNGLRDAIAKQHLLDKPRLFVATGNRVEIGKVDLEIGKYLPVVCLCPDPRNIAFGWNLKDFSGWDALLIGSDAYLPNPQRTYKRYFSDIVHLSDLDLRIGDQVVLTLRIYYAKNYLDNYPLPFAPEDVRKN